MNNNYGAQEIDLIHLFLTVLTKWRVFLLAIIIGAIVGGGYAAFKTGGDKDIKEDISSSTLVSMQTAKEYYSGYMKEKAWFNDSPIARMGYEKGCQASAQYLVKGDDALSIASVYSMLIRGDDFGSFLKEKCGGDINLEYLGEMISSTVDNYAQANNSNNVVVSVVGDRTDNQDNIKENDRTKDNNEIINGADSKIASLVTYYVRCEDADKAHAIMEALNEYVERYYVQNVGDKAYTFEKLDTFYEAYVPALQNPNYQVHLNNRNNFGQEYEKIIKAFSEDEKEYFSKNYLNGNDIKLESGVVTVVSEENSHVKDYLKRVIMGIFAGVVIAGGIICCTYLFNGRIKSVNELSVFKVPLYGIKRDSVLKHNTKLDKYLVKLLDSVSGLALSDGYVSESVILQGFDSLFIYNDSSLSDGDGICDKKLWEAIPKVYLSDKSCSSDKEALIKANELGNEIIIVELNRSRTKTLISEMETAQIQKVNVVGIICV